MLWVGVIALWGGIVVLGALTPSYSQWSHWISDLAADGAPYQLLAQLIIFGGFGGALLATGSRARVVWGDSRSAALTGRLLLGAGVGVLVAGAMNCDAGCPLLSTSPKQIAHNVSALLAFGALLAAQTVWSLAARRWTAASSYAKCSAATAVWGALSLVAVFVAVGTSASFAGAAQKSFVLATSVWLVASAVGAPGSLAAD